MSSQSEVAVRFATAVETILERVRADRRRASKPVAALLAVIAKRLFHSTFDLNDLKRRASPTSATLAAFKRELGRSAAVYIRHRRLQAAQLALGMLGATVDEASQLAGYTNRSAFSRAYRKWGGQTPTEAQGEPAPEPSLPPAAPSPAAPLPAAPQESESTPMPAARYRLAAARQDPKAPEVLSRLRARLPTVAERREAPRVELSQPGEPHERLLAQALWAAVGGLPGSEQRDLLCNVVRFRSPALFHLLGEQSRDGASADRVATAELGLQVLEAQRQRLEGDGGEGFRGEGWCGLGALGWARVGGARLAAGDVPGAEHAFQSCDEEWALAQRAAPGAPRDRLVEAEICLLRAPLRLRQGRSGEARELFDRSIELFRSGGANGLLAQALAERALMARQPDDPETDLVLLEEARKLADEERDPVLVCRTCLRLAQALVESGRSKKAEAALVHARDAVQALDDPLLVARLERAEGVVHRELGRVDAAEACLSRARRAFLELDDLARAVLTSLDLAEFWHLRGRPCRVRELVAGALPLIERIKMHRRSLEAVRLLKCALATEELTLTLLRRVRSCVEAIQRDLTTAAPPPRSRSDHEEKSR